MNENSPESQKQAVPDSVAHALALYEKAKSLSLHAKPLHIEVAKIIVVTAEDAIRGFGNSHQEKKIELEEMMREAMEVLPPATLEELKKRTEGKVLRKIHPQSKTLRNVLYALVAVVIIGSIAFSLVNVFSVRNESAKFEPRPAPFTTQPTPIAPEQNLTPLPTPTPQEPTPSPTDTPQPRPTPVEEKQPVPNGTPLWSRLTYGIEWRVAAIQPLAKGTRFFIEIKNTDASDEKSFYTFDSAPLIVIAGDHGQMFQMIGSAQVPPDLQEKYGRWNIQAGRIITVAVNFELLVKGNFSGNVLYKDQNRADPAKFSFVR